MSNSKIVHYEYSDGVATITLDDGSKNVMSDVMLAQFNGALDKAEKDKAVVILTGTGNALSAGFDLKILRSGGSKSVKMLNAGFALTTRLLSFPTPIIIACNGHAMAMGVFILLSGDYRIGIEGNYKFAANEVAIGMTMPFTATEVCRQRLNPAHFVRAVLHSEVYSPNNALEAGFLDQVVKPEELMSTAHALAKSYTKLDLNAHYRSKLRARKHLIKSLKRANIKDRLDIIRMGMMAMMKKKT